MIFRSYVIARRDCKAKPSNRDEASVGVQRWIASSHLLASVESCSLAVTVLVVLACKTYAQDVKYAGEFLQIPGGFPCAFDGRSVHADRQR